MNIFFFVVVLKHIYIDEIRFEFKILFVKA